MSGKKSQVVSTLWTTAKLGVTGAIIAAIAFAFGVFEPDMTLKESQADIMALDFAERTPRQKFEDSLDDLGHPDPRPFNMNGNVIFFSSVETEEDPVRVMERYQREFYEEGLNSRMHAETNDENQDDTMLDGQTGGIVPMSVTENHIVMGGLELKDAASNPNDLRDIYKRHDKDAPWEMYKGYRNVEITKTERNTLVTASWSDENFDYEKMFLGSEAEDQNASTEVPACVGCIRVNSFEDLQEGQNYRNDIFMGKSQPSEMATFYDRALSNRGWEATDATIAFDKVRKYANFKGEDAIMRRYSRGDEFMTVMSYLDDRDDVSVVHAVRHR